MTPEAAHSAGARATETAIVSACSIHEKSRAGVVSTIESALRCASEDAGAVAAIPFAIRGSAAFFRELADELDARAAALEATR